VPPDQSLRGGDAKHTAVARLGDGSFVVTGPIDDCWTLCDDLD
jgi:hypothetical protein